MTKRPASYIEEEGYDAGYQGHKELSDNPYDSGSDEYYAWRYGYTEGEADWENSYVDYED